MAQEFFINSQLLENKVRNLLPSQGGAGAGFDLTASTQIIPIVDLTESAEGSNLRQDLQTSFDYATTETTANNNTVTAISNTGFYRVNVDIALSGDALCTVAITDGVSPAIIRKYLCISGQNRYEYETFNVFLSAGLSMTLSSSNSSSTCISHTRQIADIEGNLTNPLTF